MLSKKITSLLKQNWLKVFSVTFLFLFFGAYANIFALPPDSPYQAGDTLDPTCLPGDTNCTVGLEGSLWSADVNGINYQGGNVGIGTDSSSSSALRLQISSNKYAIHATSNSYYYPVIDVSGSIMDGGVISVSTGSYGHGVNVSASGTNTKGIYSFVQSGNNPNSIAVYGGNESNSSTGVYGGFFEGFNSPGAIGVGSVGINSDVFLLGSGILRMKERTSSPSTPANNSGMLFAKTDGKIYFINDGGTEYDLTSMGTSSPVSVVNTSNLFSTGLTGTGSGVTTVTRSNFFGVDAGSGATGASYSNFFGYQSGYQATDAEDSNFFGAWAGSGATNADSSNFFGTIAGFNAVNANNSNFFGMGAGDSATNASYSNFLGFNAGNYATNASHSNFIGDFSGSGAEFAFDSTFLGRDSGYGATNASNSIFVGRESGDYAENASNSIFVGQFSGDEDTVNNTGSAHDWSILLGYRTNTGGFKNSILLGGATSSTPISNTKANQFMLAPSITELRWRGIDYTLPSAQGGAGTVLTNDGSGGLTWAAPSTGSSYTFSNGLTENGGAVKLGGALIDFEDVVIGGINYSTYESGIQLQLRDRPDSNKMGVFNVTTKIPFDGDINYGAEVIGDWGSRVWVGGGSRPVASFSNEININAPDGRTRLMYVGGNQGYNDTTHFLEDMIHEVYLKASNWRGTTNTKHKVSETNQLITNDIYTESSDGNIIGEVTFNLRGSDGIAGFDFYLDDWTNGLTITSPSDLSPYNYDTHFLPISVNGTFADASGNITIAGGGATSIDGLSDAISDGSSIFLGAGAGAVDDGTDNRNLGVGLNSLNANTTGVQNTAFGNYSLYSNYGHYNTAIGYRSLYANANGTQNVALGESSLGNNTSGGQNTGIGYQALLSNISGDYNTAIGINALRNTTSGFYNTAIGEHSGVYIADGSTSNTTSDYSVYLGSRTKAFADNSQNEIVIGYNAIGNGSNTATIGNSSLLRTYLTGVNLKAGTATAGTAPLKFTSGTLLTTPESGALEFDGTHFYGTVGSTRYQLDQQGGGGVSSIDDLSDAINDYGNENLWIGGTPTSLSGLQNLALGQAALSGNVSGFVNTALGRMALYLNTSGSMNTAVGDGAMHSNTIGSYNVALGVNSLGNNITGQSNVAVGNSSLNSNTSGRYNNAFGDGALSANTTGYYNIAIGLNSFNSNTTGSDNISIGHQTASSVTTNDYSIYIGGMISSAADDSQNEIVIGYNAIGQGSNSVVIGDNTITKTVLSGKVGIGNLSPNYSLQVGSVSVSGIVARFQNSTGTCDINPTSSSLACSSDINLKKNIVLIAEGNEDFTLNEDIEVGDTVLDKLKALNPVTYNWLTESNSASKHVGLIAQEVEQIFPDVVLTDKDTGLKSIAYTNLIPYTIEAIKEMNLKLANIDDIDKPNTWRDAMSRWLGNISNGIESLYARVIYSDRVETKTLCVGDVCVNEDDFLKMVNNSKMTQFIVIPTQTEKDSEKIDTGSSEEEIEEVDDIEEPVSSEDKKEVNKISEESGEQPVLLDEEGEGDEEPAEKPEKIKDLTIEE